VIAAGHLYLGLFALAAGMSRHGLALLGPWHTAPRARSLPLAGWVLVALSLLAALATPDWPRALVTWFGLAPLAAGIVLLSLTFAPQPARWSALLAVLLVLAGAATALVGGSTAI